MLLIVVAGCDLSALSAKDSDEPAACSESGTIAGTVVGPQADTAITGDVTVRGTITRPDDVTIYRVEIAGLLATSDAFDFADWSAKVPFETLSNLADATGSLTLTATAITNCSGDAARVPLGNTKAFNVVPAAADLKIDVAYPSAGDYLPADGSQSADITVSGAPSTSGDAVTLTASAGSFSDPLPKLAGDGSSRAKATTKFSSMKAGAAVLTATLANQAKNASVVVVGAPTLSPAGATLHSGQSVGVTVALGGGKIAACSTSPVTAISVTSGSIDLTTTDGATDVDGDGDIDVVVSAPTSLAAAATVTLTCQDVYLQKVSAAFTAVP